MFTFFVDYMLKCLFALLITCSHVYLLWWSQTTIFICFNDHMLQCSHASMIKCFHVYMLWWSHSHMQVCFYPHCSYRLQWSFVPMLTCLEAQMLDCSRAWMPTYLNVHTLTCFNDYMIPCSHALMITWSHAHMLPLSHALMIPCYHPYMLGWLHAPMHWYSHVWYPHTCAHTCMMICPYAWKLKLEIHVLKCFNDCAWMLRW